MNFKYLTNVAGAGILVLMTTACGDVGQSYGGPDDSSSTGGIPETPIMSLSAVQYSDLEFSKRDVFLAEGDFLRDPAGLHQRLLEFNHPADQLNMFRSKIKVNLSGKILDFTFADIAFDWNDTKKTYDRNPSRDKICEQTAQLTQLELDRLTIAVGGLGLCKIKRAPATTGVGTIVLPPDGADVIVGDPHIFTLSDQGEVLYSHDFTDMSYPGYVHTYVCGDKAQYLSVIRDIVMSRDVSGCPDSAERLFKIER